MVTDISLKDLKQTNHKIVKPLQKKRRACLLLLNELINELMNEEDFAKLLPFQMIREA